MGDSIYEISSDRCTGAWVITTRHLPESVPDPEHDPGRIRHVESEEQLWDKFVLMHHTG